MYSGYSANFVWYGDPEWEGADIRTCALSFLRRAS